MTDKSASTGSTTMLPPATADEAGFAAAGMARVTAVFETAIEELEPVASAPLDAGVMQLAEIVDAEPGGDTPQVAEAADADSGTELVPIDDSLLPVEVLVAIPGEDSLPGQPESGSVEGTKIPNEQASFAPGPGPEILPGIPELGPLDPTALQYRVPEYEPRRFGDDRDRGGMDDGGPTSVVSAQNDVLRIQETSEGTGNQPLAGEMYQFSQQLGVVGPLPHQYIDEFVDGYQFSVAAASVDAAGGLLANDSPAPLSITSISYLGNNDGSLGTITENFDGMENRMTFAAQYGGEAIWTITFDLDDGSYDFVQHHAYAHLGTPGDVLQENFGYEVTEGMGNVASAAFTLEIVDDMPTTAAFDLFLTDVLNGSDGDSGVQGNLLSGGLGADNFWFDPNVGPTGTGYEAFYGVDNNNDDAPDYLVPIQAFEADDLGADGGHMYSVTYGDFTYQRIWTGSELDPNSMLLIENGVEMTVPLSPYASFESGNVNTADYFGLTVLLTADIFGTPEGTLFIGNYWDLEETGTPDPFTGTLSYRVIDGDGDISGSQDVPFQIVDAHVYFGSPAIETPQTLANLDQFLG